MANLKDSSSMARPGDEAPQSHSEANGSPLEGIKASRRKVLAAAMAGSLGLAASSRANAQAASGSATAGVTTSAQESATPAATGEASTSNGKPNILVIFGDDIGYWNVSAYSLGVMGYQTPNIDRIAREGIQFSDAYGEQSCTAGRAAFITGQSPFRTGLLSIGMPGEDQGLQPDDPTIADLLKPLGYATGQFGKNHLGDRNEFLPTVHGFDEFFGILYHLNAYEEPENPDYPTDPAFFEQYGPRNLLHTWASEEDDPTEDPRFGRVGKQVIADEGVLDTERMQRIDDEAIGHTMHFINRAHENDQPFFVWFNPTRMHIWTHLKPESEGVTGLGSQADGMVEHDGHVGQLLQQLDDLGIAENTIVIYATDNGAQLWSWPDGNTTPFRSEKNSNWEGAYRIPMLARWPGHFSEGALHNGIVSLQDWLPTLLAAAGVPDATEQLLDGYQGVDKEFRAHIDGYNQLDYLTGASDESARDDFFYFNDDGELTGLRMDQWKTYFMEQKSDGLDVWFEPFDDLRRPRVVNLRIDPLERAMEVSGNYDEWLVRHAFVMYPVQETVQEFYETFMQFPPQQAQDRVEQIRELIQRLQQAQG